MASFATNYRLYQDDIYRNPHGKVRVRTTLYTTPDAGKSDIAWHFPVRAFVVVDLPYICGSKYCLCASESLLCSVLRRNRPWLLASSYRHVMFFFCFKAGHMTHTKALRSMSLLFQYAFLWPLMLPDDKQAGDEAAQPGHGDAGGDTRQSCAAGDNDIIDSTKTLTKGEVDSTCNLPWLFSVYGQPFVVADCYEVVL